MYSVNQIHNTMLENIPEDYQKTEGFPTFDITRGISFGQYQLWKKAFEIEEKQNVDNLTGEELERFVLQRSGLIRNDSVQAIATLTVLAGGGRVIVGDTFETPTGIQFQCLENKDVVVDSTFEVQAVIGGANGNVGANSITVIPKTIQGVAKVTNITNATGGYNKETDNEFRQRYYDYLRIPATCGNKYHYMVWSKEVDGVGGVRCFPCWQGKNTVEVVIIGNDNLPASDSLVKAVQDYIDPNKTGEGLGVAPIGAVTTVTSATGLNVNVTANVTISTSADESEVIAKIKTSLGKYIKSLAFVSQYVSFAHVGAAILDVEGVLDYSDMTINGAMQNLEIADHEVAVLGEVVINV